MKYGIDITNFGYWANRHPVDELAVTRGEE